MTTITFDEEKLNLTTIKNVLKALGVRKIKVQEEPYKVKYTKEEFTEMINESAKTKYEGVSLKTEQEVKDFFKSI